MTYSEIQSAFLEKNEKTISTCAIADSKRKLGYNLKVSKRRKDSKRIMKPATNFEFEEVRIILTSE